MERFGKTRKAVGAGLALLALALLAGCLGSEASEEELLGASAAAGRGATGGPEAPSLDELVAALGLSDEQAAVVGPALDELASEMESRRPRGRSGRGPGGGGQCRGERGGSGRGGFGPGGFGPGGGGEGERPLHGFLETVVPVLETAQVEALADFFEERRDAHRAASEDRGRGGRRGGPLLGLMLRHAADDLGLDDEQREALLALMESRRDDIRALREGFADGSLSAEQVRDRSTALREEIEAEVARILSAEQFAALEEMLQERREEMTERRLERLEEGVDDRAAFLASVLELDDGTAAAVRAILDGSTAQRRTVLEQLRDGTIEIEEALYRGHVISEEAKAEIAGALDSGQARVFTALHRLLPGGGRRGH